MPDPSPDPDGAAGVPGATRRGVAAFDVDGTLTTRDCVVPFLRTVGGTRATAARLARGPRRLVSALARRDRDAVKALAAEATFAGRTVAEVERSGAEFATHVQEHWVRPDTMGLVRHHQEQGHDVVLVSASFGVYVRPLAAALGIESVLATELVVGPDGRFTGELDGGNCRGPNKVRRLHSWLKTTAGGRNAVELWAYGDSPGDAAMLDDADHAVWILPT